MCVLSIKVPIQKKSGNLLYAPCMYMRVHIYIYIYIYIYVGVCIVVELPIVVDLHKLLKMSNVVIEFWTLFVFILSYIPRKIYWSTTG